MNICFCALTVALLFIACSDSSEKGALSACAISARTAVTQQIAGNDPSAREQIEYYLAELETGRVPRPVLMDARLFQGCEPAMLISIFELIGSDTGTDWERMRA